MNIETSNDFIYISETYTNPYFVLSYIPMLDLDITLVDCFMYSSKESYLNNSRYIHSFGSEVSNDIVFDDNQVTDSVISLLTEISPSTTFTKEN